jgi:hypothetical protein
MEVQGVEGHVSYCDHGPQQTRALRRCIDVDGERCRKEGNVAL